MPKLILSTWGGIGDKICTMLTGYRIAQSADREFMYRWRASDSCPILFEEAFSSSINVVSDISDIPYKREIPVELRRGIKGGATKFVDYLKRDNDDIFLIMCLPHNYSNFHLIHPNERIKRSVENFKAVFFDSKVLGVHIRRTDKIVDFAGIPSIKTYTNAVDDFISVNSDHKILLATDDGGISPEGNVFRNEGIVDIFKRRYGNKLITYPVSSLDRRSKNGTLDAVATLFLLRETDFFIGSGYSGYSKMAATRGECTFIGIQPREDFIPRGADDV